MHRSSHEIDLLAEVVRRADFHLVQAALRDRVALSGLAAARRTDGVTVTFEHLRLRVVWRIVAVLDHPVIARLPDWTPLVPGAAVRALLVPLREEVLGGEDGAEAIVDGLSRSLFVALLRQLARTDPAYPSALRVFPVRRALEAVHADPAAPWTAASLAGVAGVSRASLYRAFVRATGLPPGAYVTQWRMVCAQRLLAGAGLTIAEIAEAVGYASPVAFTRAFRRHTGVAPRRWRAHRRTWAVPGGAPDPIPEPVGGRHPPS